LKATANYQSIVQSSGFLYISKIEIDESLTDE